MGAFLILLSLFVIAATAISPSQRQDVIKVVELSNQLGVELHKKLATDADNIIFSPISISTALAMLFYGARGLTAEEMRRALGYQKLGLTDPGVHSAFRSLIEAISENSASKKYLLANALIIQQYYHILPEYKNGLYEIYKAAAYDVDFVKGGQKAVQVINSWVNLKTNGKIQKLLDQIDPTTIAVLLNAVYFKGTWKTQFDPRHTMEKVFFNNGLENEGVRVPMMYLSEDLPYARLRDAKVVELPYKGEDISMIIFLPDAMDGLAKLEQELKPNTIQDMRRQIQKTKVHVTLPKFKLGYQKTLNSVLQQLGIKNVFEDSANLSGITKSGPIAVSEVVHKAVVEVNEEGSEASAATGVLIHTRAGGIHKEEFFVDRPFLFVIVDRRYDLILFQGRVNRLYE